MKKLFFSLFAVTFLTGCVQSTAMIGPAMTLVSTGNTTHAFGTFLTNKAVEEETGMQTHELIAKKVEEQKNRSQLLSSSYFTMAQADGGGQGGGTGLASGIFRLFGDAAETTDTGKPQSDKRKISSPGCPDLH